MSEKDDAEIKRLLEETLSVEKENQALLKKLYRHSWWGLVIRVVWYALLVGLPFALYFYILEPYFGMFGSSYDQFRAGIRELPGYKGFELFMSSILGA